MLAAGDARRRRRSSVAIDSDTPGAISLETDVAWVPTLDVRFHLGVDGISLPLVLLTALLTFLCLRLLAARPAGGRPARALVVCVLLLEVGMLGTFVALDLLLFFVFFEVVLVPMWFVIARWGDPHDRPGRARAANKFILYTLLGSRGDAARLPAGRARSPARSTWSRSPRPAASGHQRNHAGHRRPGARARPRGQDADVAAAHLAARRAHRRARPSARCCWPACC